MPSEHLPESSTLVHTATSTTKFPIVGIAASAGGLEAFTQLLSHLPLDTGMAFVLILHLSPDRESLLTEILTRVTPMLVSQAQEGMVVEPNRVYVIPPNKKMVLDAGVLKLSPRERVFGKYMPGDAFLTSLAANLGNLAIGVVLSGGDGDGALGLTAIRDAGGVTFAQCEATANVQSMPTSAIATGNVDFVLSPEQIAAELVEIGRDPLRIRPQPVMATTERGTITAQTALMTIFALLKSTTGVDFSHYKPKTLDRRIQRRMLVCRIEQLADYVAYLQAQPTEVKALYEEILIHVTSFFRDPRAFELLETTVFPTITQNKSAELPIRIWVAGCSTGEEVYSIAICLLEFLSERALQPSIQIFATDISELAIDKARTGIYAEDRMVDISPERRRRFFYEVEGGYHISKAVRELCVFARQDLSSDPPFSNVDLISCRNVMIYLGDALQQRIMPIFHYSLNATGFLLLGTSESTGKSVDLFNIIDKKHRIYAKNPATTQPTGSFFPSSYPTVKMSLQKGFDRENLRDRQLLPAAGSGFDLHGKIDRLIVERYTPIGVVIDDKMQVLQLRGEVDKYLKLVSGVANFDLFNLVRSGFAIELRAAIERAQQSNLPITKTGLKLSQSNDASSFNIQVIPFEMPNVKASHFLVLFEDVPAMSGQGSESILQSRRYALAEPALCAYELLPPSDIDRENAQLRQELTTAIEERQATQEYLRALIQEQESSNQDLVIVLLDIDALKRSAATIAAARNYAEAIVETVQIPLLVLESDLRVNTANRAFYDTFEVSKLETDRATLFELGNGQWNIPSLRSILEEMFTTERSLHNFEVAHSFDRIGPKTMLLNGWKIIADGDPNRILLSIEDITERKQFETERSHLLVQEQSARQSAETANRAKDEFLSNLSHELRNPLTAIVGWAKLLHENQLEQTKIARGLEVIYRSAQAQSQLIEDILDLSRITSGKLQLASQRLDLVSVVNAAIESVQLAANAKSIQIDTSLMPTTLVGDVHRLGQVFWNLLTNAIKFTPAGGRVEITTSASPTEIEILVRDTGRGMSAELLPHIFDRFRQGDSSSSKSTQGLGLGLAIVRQIVESHGGTVWAESAGVGQGATLIVQLPLDLAAISMPEGFANDLVPRQSLAMQETIDLQGLRLLVVDDEVDILDLIKYILENAGATVTLANSAQAAMASLVAAGGSYDALLADIGMPAEDGFALIRQVRALAVEAGGQIPAMAITAYASERDRQLTLDAGFGMHLAKPIAPARLIQMVSTLTGRTSTNN